MATLPCSDAFTHWQFCIAGAFFFFFSSSTSTSAAPSNCMATFTQSWTPRGIFKFPPLILCPPSFRLKRPLSLSFTSRCRLFPSSPPSPLCPHPSLLLFSSREPPLRHDATNSHHVERRQFSEGRVVLHNPVIRRMSGREWEVGGGVRWDWDGWTEAWEADRRFKLFHLNAAAHQQVITARLSNKTFPTPSSKRLFSMVL